jgi:hypothetical protein
LARNGQARLEINRLVAHQAHEPAHPLCLDGVPVQAQVVAQAQHALEVVGGELLIEQAHEVEVVGAFPAGLVVEAATRKAQGLAAGLYRMTAVALYDQGALLDY